VRFLLDSVANWTVGDRLEVQYGSRRILNPTTLWFARAFHHGNRRWFPVNTDPVHAKNNIYTVTVQEGPLWLRLATYEDA